MATSSPFTRLRESIRATRSITYLNTGYSGPSPDAVIDRVREVLETEATIGPASVEGLAYAEAINLEAKREVAAYFNCNLDEVAITHGTTDGCYEVIFGIDWQPGDEIVTTNLEHPTLAMVANVLEERFGVIARRVELPPAGESAAALTQRVADAINPRTKLVALSHIQFSCGLKLPGREIVAAAHAANVPVLLDGAQTGGQIPIDVRALGVDFYAISGQKWLLGPEATGALYVSRDYQRRLAPSFMTHTVADKYFGESEVLSRFWLASQSPATVAGFATALNGMQAIGISEAETYCRGLADRLRGGIASIKGIELTGPTAPELTCGLVAMRIEGWEPQQAVDALWERWRISGRSVPYPAAVRFSTASFNNEADIDQALQALNDLTQTLPA